MKEWNDPKVVLPDTDEKLPGRERDGIVLRVRVEVMFENGKTDNAQFRRYSGQAGGGFCGFTGTTKIVPGFDFNEGNDEWHVFGKSGYYDTHSPERAVQKWRYLE